MKIFAIAALMGAALVGWYWQQAGTFQKNKDRARQVFVEVLCRTDAVERVVSLDAKTQSKTPTSLSEMQKASREIATVVTQEIDIISNTMIAEMSGLGVSMRTMKKIAAEPMATRVIFQETTAKEALMACQPVVKDKPTVDKTISFLFSIVERAQ
jgi:hypothetical protein